MDFPKSLEPDEEQKLFEALAMEKSEREFLDFIRHSMKILLTQENNNDKKEDRSTGG